MAVSHDGGHADRGEERRRSTADVDPQPTDVRPCLGQQRHEHDRRHSDVPLAEQGGGHEHGEDERMAVAGPAHEGHDGEHHLEEEHALAEGLEGGGLPLDDVAQHVLSLQELCGEQQDPRAEGVDHPQHHAGGQPPQAALLHGGQIAVQAPAHELHPEVHEAEREGPVGVDPHPAHRQQPTGVQPALDPASTVEREARGGRTGAGAPTTGSRPPPGTGPTIPSLTTMPLTDRARRQITAKSRNVRMPTRTRSPVAPASSSTAPYTTEASQLCTTHSVPWAVYV